MKGEEGDKRQREEEREERRGRRVGMLNLAAGAAAAAERHAAGQQGRGGQEGERGERGRRLAQTQASGSGSGRSSVLPRGGQGPKTNRSQPRMQQHRTTQHGTAQSSRTKQILAQWGNTQHTSWRSRTKSPPSTRQRGVNVSSQAGLSTQEEHMLLSALNLSNNKSLRTKHPLLYTQSQSRRAVVVWDKPCCCCCCLGGIFHDMTVSYRWCALPFTHCLSLPRLQPSALLRSSTFSSSSERSERTRWQTALAHRGALGTKLQLRLARATTGQRYAH